MRKMILATAIVAAFISGCIVTTNASPATGGRQNADAAPDSVDSVRAKEYVFLGVDYYRKKEYQESIENLMKALEYVPNQFNGVLTLGVVYQDLGDTDSAKLWYHKLYEIYPDSLQGYLGLGGVYLTMASDVDPMYLDSALETYTKGLARFSGNSDLLYGVAVSFTRKGLTSEADSVYKAAIESNPENLGARNAFVDFLMEQGRYSEALPHEEFIVKAHPEDPLARDKLGDIYTKLDKCKEAAVHYDTLVQLFPATIDGRNKLAQAYSCLKKYSDAERVLKEAIELDSTRLTPHIYLGIVYMNWGKEGSAEQEFKYLLSKDENEPNALYFLGVIYARRAGKALNEKTVQAWQAGCANARTATNYLERAKAANPGFRTNVDNQLKYLDQVRAELKKKLFLQGISDC